MKEKRTISIKTIRESGYYWNRKNNSPRGCETVPCTEINIGDEVVVNNYFTEVVEEEEK